MRQPLCGNRYRNVIQRYPALSLMEERRLIASAQRGSERSVQELVLRHIGFVSFRLHRRVFPDLLRRVGEELLSEAIPIPLALQGQAKTDTDSLVNLLQAC